MLPYITVYCHVLAYYHKQAITALESLLEVVEEK